MALDKRFKIISFCLPLSMKKKHFTKYTVGTFYSAYERFPGDGISIFYIDYSE